MTNVHFWENQSAIFVMTNVPLSGGPMYHFREDQCATFGMTNVPLLE